MYYIYIYVQIAHMIFYCQSWRVTSYGWRSWRITVKTQAFGLSDSLGAFVGGVLVAETDYKHQIEVRGGRGWRKVEVEPDMTGDIPTITNIVCSVFSVLLLFLVFIFGKVPKGCHWGSIFQPSRKVEHLTLWCQTWVPKPIMPYLGGYSHP